MTRSRGPADRGRGAKLSRHRVVPGERDAAGRPDADLESYLAALSPSAPGFSELTGRFSTAQVFQLRLPLDRIFQLRTLAEARDVAPASLARDWVVERLDVELAATVEPEPPGAAEVEVTDAFLGGRPRGRFGRHRSQQPD